MTSAVFDAHKIAEFRIIRIVVPAIVVPEVVARIIRRIGKDKIDLSAIAVHTHHRLEIFAFNYAVFGLLLRTAD
jgi:hypothetical protein